jgi:hypothetical protein
VPVLDCVANQNGTCDLEQRTCQFSLDLKKINETFVPEERMQLAPRGYGACAECVGENRFKGTIWWQKQNVANKLEWREALKVNRKFSARLKGRDFKVISYPNSTINVKGIDAQLDIWEHFDGFVADLVIIDYADILAAEDTKKEARHQVNDTWKAMRALSQKRHCLVLTATQTDTDSFDVETMSLKNFSEDKRKYGHVTGMLGLNQTSNEKMLGIMRIAWIIRREGEAFSNICVRVLECRKIGRPYLDSYY